LSGDASDNIPGVPSVGPKTAIKWLQLYGDIEGVKSNANKIDGKVGEKLRESFDLLDLSYQLVKLKFDVDLASDVFDDEPGENTEKLRELYTEYGFSMWLKQLADQIKEKPITKTIEPLVSESQDQKNTLLLQEFTQTLILKQADFESLLKQLSESTSFVFDLETNSLDYMNAEIVGLVFLLDKQSYYLPVAHDYLDAPEQLSRQSVMKSLKPILESQVIGKIGQNLKYDAHVLANIGIDLSGIVDDTMIKSYCLNSVATRHNMDDLSEHYLGHKTIHFVDVAGSGKKQLTFNQVNIDEALPYACEDVIVTSELNKILESKLLQYPKLMTLYRTLELPLVNIMLKLERNGALVDEVSLFNQQVHIKSEMQEIQTQAFEIAGDEFNLESPKQIQQILFSEEGLGSNRKRKLLKVNHQQMKKR